MPQFFYQHPSGYFGQLQGSIPQESGLRAPTWSDRFRGYKDTIGRAISPLLGMNFDERAQAEAEGKTQAVIPLTSPSPWGQKLLNTGIRTITDEVPQTVRARIIDPEKVTNWNSAFIDTPGHVIDVSPAIHDEALHAMFPEATPLMNESGRAAALRKTGFTRAAQPDINPVPRGAGFEAHVAPTPEQIDSAKQIMNTGIKNYPKYEADIEMFTPKRKALFGLTTQDMINNLLFFK